VYYLDWLRVLAILTVFVYHSTRFFNMEDWHVKNPTWYPAVEVWNLFAGTWMMPLIFVISGASLFYAVGKGGAGKFVKDKTLRLLVPLLVGVFTHASLQVYLERITHGQFSGTYFQFLPQYFNGFYEGGNPASGNFALTGMHLWYLWWLFLFSILLYPLLHWLKGGGRRVLSRVGDWLALPGAIYVLALPILLLQMFVDPGDPIMAKKEAGWYLVIYLCLLLSDWSSRTMVYKPASGGCVGLLDADRGSDGFHLFPVFQPTRQPSFDSCLISAPKSECLCRVRRPWAWDARRNSALIDSANEAVLLLHPARRCC
jgi:hypothetical protein